MTRRRFTLEHKEQAAARLSEDGVSYAKVNALEQEKALGKAGKLAAMLTKVGLAVLDEFDELFLRQLSKHNELTPLMIRNNSV